MFLKFNASNIIKERRLIFTKNESTKNKDIINISGDTCTYNIMSENHQLKVGDSILFTGILEDIYRPQINGKIFTERGTVIKDNYSKDSFSFILPTYYNIYITDKIILNKNGLYAYKFTGDTLINSGITIYSDINDNGIECSGMTDNNGNVGYMFYTDNSDIIVNKQYKVSKDIPTKYEIYEEQISFKINVPISSNNANELNDENISKTYFEEKKKELIPEITDYEKRCFTPVYKSGNTSYYLSKMRFNLFFRDRGNEETRLSNGWVSDDTKGWNQCSITDNGTINTTTAYTRGDLLSYLNFSDEDVYYRKKKLSKSFLRLSFYDNQNPLNQMLLFYSTIFFDSGDAYLKYINRIDEKIKTNSDNTSYSLVNTIFNKDEYTNENNLTASFIVRDRFNRSKCSEGFYLYLFPDKLNEESGKTIYMKAEFNHAGYGKTVPLILPTSTDNTILNFSHAEFPEHLISKDGTLEDYYKHLYIPITVKYDNNLKDYVYHFQNSNLFENVINNELEINLYEPKINSIKE